jgi:hydrogenase/urease accessory protein HupE
MKKTPLLYATLAGIFLLFPILLSAHSVNYQLEGAPTGSVLNYYLPLGFQHILPMGLDHILFVIGLYLLNPTLKSVVTQATIFTVAHSITLCLSMNNTIQTEVSVIEPIIALSIAFIALENLFFQEIKPWRMVLIFAFGLIHGMGFASALNEIGLPRDAFYTSLIGFNIGVELGQITVILACYLLFGRWFAKKNWYRQRIVFPISILIACVAMYWTIERLI